MALSEAQKAYIDFNKGLFTEASPLNRPDNTSLDELNFEINRLGYRKRRKGLDVQESPYNNEYVYGGTPTFSHPSDAYEYQTYRWDVGPALTLHVVKSGHSLYFFEELSTGDLEAQNGTYDSVDLALYSPWTYATAQANIRVDQLSFAQANGYLFVAGKDINTVRIHIDNSGWFVTEEIDPLVRDTDGIEDGEGTRNPAVLTNNHKYNLWNQGWSDTNITTYFTAAGSWPGGTYPSNAQIWHYGKYIDPTNGLEQFSPIHLSWQDFGSRLAPRGRFFGGLYNPSYAFDEYFDIPVAIGTQPTYNNTTKRLSITTTNAHGLVAGNFIYLTNMTLARSNNPNHTFTITSAHQCTAGTGGTTIEIYADFGITWTTWDYVNDDPRVHKSMTNLGAPRSMSYRLEQCEFFSNRLWLAGSHGELFFNSRIYYSQTYETINDLSKFHTEGDPTSEYSADLYPTDGGFLSIPDIGKILKLQEYGKALLIFASNGVWVVGPGDRGYFAADDYSLTRISTASVIFPEAIVRTESSIVYYTTEGMFLVSPDKFGEPTVQNVSVPTIQTLYQTIISNAKRIKAVYDDANQKIYWFYNLGETNVYGLKEFSLTNCLVLDMAAQAFYKYSFYEPNSTYSQHQVVGATTIRSYINDTNKLKVFVRCPPSAGDSSRDIRVFEFKQDATFTDFKSFVGSPTPVGWAPPCYLETTYENMGDIARRKYATYVNCYFNRTETTGVSDGMGGIDLTVPSSCMMQAKWEWTSSSVSGKETTEREVYRFRRYYQPIVGTYEDGMPVVVTKNKVRGTGKVLSLRFRVPDYKDCQLLGWQILWHGVTTT